MKFRRRRHDRCVWWCEFARMLGRRNLFPGWSATLGENLGAHGAANFTDVGFERERDVGHNTAIIASACALQY
jgi:hypothetical protein